MSPEIATILFIATILLGVLTGYPIAILLGALALGIGFFDMGPTVFTLMYTRSYTILLNYTMLAIPLFVFMGYVLGHSGIADRLFNSLYLLFGRVRGGLAISTVIIGAILAACVGVIGASIAILVVLALPSMMKRNYSKSLATGSVCASGSLGILIPPSIMLVLYGPMASISVGKLFMGAIFPGLLLAGLYIGYIAVRSSLQREIAPAAPPEEREMPVGKKMSMLLVSLFPPAFLILAVLGSIFMGIAPPTEAAAVGCLGAVLLAIAYRRFNLKILKQCALDTLRVTSFIMFIGCFAYALVGVFLVLGCGDVIESLILASPGGKWGAFAIIMLIIFILGMFIDWLGILFILIPILSPVIISLGFDPLWFALMVCINLQMSFLTPPMAPAIFFLKGMTTPEQKITTGDIIRGVLPFVGIIAVVIGLCVLFPDIILWLPNKMLRVGW